MNNGKNSIQEITLEQMAKVSGGTVDAILLYLLYTNPHKHVTRRTVGPGKIWDSF